MKITVDTEERRAQINRQYESTIRSIKAKREKLNKQEQSANKFYRTQLAEIDALERVYGNGEPKSKPKQKTLPIADDSGPRRPHRNYTAEERRKHATEIAGFDRKDLLAYSELHNIPITTLYGWRTKHGTKKSAPKISKQQQVLNHLAIKPMTSRELTKITGFKRHSVDSMLHTMKKKGKVFSTKFGKDPAVYSLRK